MKPHYVSYRWKYAEEWAKYKDGCVLLCTLPDEVYEEDGEEYTRPRFGVFHFGPNAQIVGLIVQDEYGDQTVHEVELSES